MTLRDEEAERQFIMQLKQAGIPISDHTVLESVDIDFDAEVEKIAEEKADKILAQMQLQDKIIKALEAKGLPMTPELLVAIQQQQTPVDPSQPQPANLGVGQGITAPVNTPDITQDPNAMAIAQQDYQTLPPMPQQAGGVPPQAPQAPASPQSPPSMGGNGLLPVNQVGQRPEISDNMRQGKKSSIAKGPSTVGAFKKLTPESIDHFVENRPWTRSLKKGRP